MYREKFDKVEFQKTVKSNVKRLYRKTVEEATQQQLFQAVSYAVKDDIIDRWLMTQEQYKKDDPKTVYYMSMEFLMGRALGNNLINLTDYKEVQEALEEMGINLNVIEDQEPDAALGNGGLGRLAACFLDSLATLGYAAYGCGIRYHYGMFKQKIENGYQVETPDNWLKEGNPFEIRREEYAKEVRFGGNIRVEKDPKTGRMMMTEVAGSEYTVDVDLVLIAAGFLGSQDYVTKAFGVEVNERTNVKTAPGKYDTNVKNVFTAGDMHRGQSLVVWAIREGREAAREVDISLMGYTNMYVQ